MTLKLTEKHNAPDWSKLHEKTSGPLLVEISGDARGPRPVDQVATTTNGRTKSKKPKRFIHLLILTRMSKKLHTHRSDRSFGSEQHNRTETRTRRRKGEIVHDLGGVSWKTRHCDSAEEEPEARHCSVIEDSLDQLLGNFVTWVRTWKVFRGCRP